VHGAVQRRLGVLGFEPDCGGEALLERVLRATPGVTGATFDEARHAVCVEFSTERVGLRQIIAAIERIGFRATESREPCPCC